METYEIFDIWAPEESIWSTWVKPVIFTDRLLSADGDLDLTGVTFSTVNTYSRHFALIVNLPGVDSIRYGLLLARQGFRPVPLFNAMRSESGRSAVDMAPIIAALGQGAKILQGIPLPNDAPPAFLLDSERMKGTAGPGSFDNRWVTIPQDFPSGTMLLSHWVKQVAVIESDNRLPSSDLTDVLRPWKKVGLEIYLDYMEKGEFSGAGRTGSKRLESIGTFSLWRMALSAMLVASLRRNPSGAFGVSIPEIPEYSGSHWSGG